MMRERFDGPLIVSLPVQETLPCVLRPVQGSLGVGWLDKTLEGPGLPGVILGRFLVNALPNEIAQTYRFIQQIKAPGEPHGDKTKRTCNVTGKL